MNTNPNKGEIALRSGLVLSAQLTRKKFLESQEGLHASVVVENESWCTYRLGLIDDPVAIALTFNGEFLDAIILSVVDPSFGANWEEWSEEKELSRKKANDQWLLENGFSPNQEYSWGSVWSDYDPKSGSSNATFRFADVS